MDKILVSVVIPTLNEGRNLVDTVGPCDGTSGSSWF